MENKGWGTPICVVMLVVIMIMTFIQLLNTLGINVDALFR